MSSIQSCHLVWGVELPAIQRCASCHDGFPDQQFQDLDIPIWPTWIQRKIMTPGTLNMIWAREVKWGGSSICHSVTRNCHINVHPPISFLKWISAVLWLVPGWYLVFMVISTTSHQVSFKRSTGSGIWLSYHIGLNSQVTSYTWGLRRTHRGPRNCVWMG